VRGVGRSARRHLGWIAAAIALTIVLALIAVALLRVLA
jgi:hypothetical protein